MTTQRNVVLAGLMGTGKSTVSRLLGSALSRPVLDVDSQVERAAGASVAEIVAVEGEAGFRLREAQAVRHAADRNGVVIAVGGGAVCDPANRAALRATGVVVVLDGDPEILAARCARRPGSRPLLAGTDPATRLAELRDARARDYARAADVTVDTSHRTVHQVRDTILDWLSETGALDAHHRTGAPDPTRDPSSDPMSDPMSDR